MVLLLRLPACSMVSSVREMWVSEQRDYVSFGFDPSLENLRILCHFIHSLHTDLFTAKNLKWDEKCSAELVCVYIYIYIYI